MKKAILIAFAFLALSAVAMMAADLTGTWTGTFTPDGDQPGGAYLVLRQEGTKVTGTAGPSVDEQHEISNGKVENGALTFEIVTENSTMKFELKQDGDEIRGDAVRQHDGETQRAHLSVTRKK